MSDLIHQAQIEALDNDVVLIVDARTGNLLHDYMLDNDIDTENYRISVNEDYRRLFDVYAA